MEYLRIVSTTMDKPTYQSADEIIIEDEYSDDKSSIEGESEHVQLCVVCLQTRHEPHVLVPCGHGNLCGFCARELTSLCDRIEEEEFYPDQRVQWLELLGPRRSARTEADLTHTTQNKYIKRGTKETRQLGASSRPVQPPHT